jgi:hypothetical protein
MGILDPLNAATLTSGALAVDETSIDTLLGIAGVTLAQAQTAKSSFVDAIFHAKRQVPIAVTVTAGAFTWDARDEAVAALAIAVANVNAAAPGAVVTAVNSNFASLVSQLNTIAGDLYNQFPAPPTASLTPIAAPSLSLAWIPNGQTAAVTLTGGDVTTLLAAIAARRAALQGIRLTAQATVVACANVAAVIAASVSTGWP